LKNTVAQRGFGNPKIPEEIAGIDRVLHLSSFAFYRVFNMASVRGLMFSFSDFYFYHLGPTAWITNLHCSLPDPV